MAGIPQDTKEDRDAEEVARVRREERMTQKPQANSEQP
jgi:hypothetical protein